jgi:hypothetical protein
MEPHDTGFCPKIETDGGAILIGDPDHLERAALTGEKWRGYAARSFSSSAGKLIPRQPPSWRSLKFDFFYL